MYCGRQWIDAGGLTVPLWASNAHVRRFSLEWETCVVSQGRTALKVMAYDIDMPVSVQFGQGPSVAKPLTRRQWMAWQPTAEERNPAFTIRLGDVSLAQGVLRRDPHEP